MPKPAGAMSLASRSTLATAEVAAGGRDASGEGVVGIGDGGAGGFRGAGFLLEADARRGAAEALAAGDAGLLDDAGLFAAAGRLRDAGRAEGPAPDVVSSGATGGDHGRAVRSRTESVSP